MADAKAMTEIELRSIVQQKVTGALGYLGGLLSNERLTAEKYYKGEPFGNEQEGRSQVISRDVAEAVDSLLPQILKPFTSGEDVVSFQPRKPQDEELAKQETDYCNWVWNQQNPGFLNFHTWFKDALLKKLGIVKIWWDESEDPTKETYHDLTDIEVQALQADPDVEIVEDETYPNPAANLPPLLPNLPPPSPVLHTVVLNRTKKSGRIRIMPVPPEEFLIDHRAVSLDESPFLAHRLKRTISELKEMGFDPAKVDKLASADGGEDWNQERIDRFSEEDEYPYRTTDPADPSMREVWVVEAYLKVDYDGDGIAEERMIVMAGDGNYEILENEPVDGHPFCELTPIPMPHKVFGMSIADQTTDLQLIKSTLWRGALDSMYLGIAPMVGVVNDQVNLDDLLNRRPGGIVRLKLADALVPIETVQVADGTFQMIEYLDTVRETRTGVQRNGSALNADALNAYSGTATGVRAMQSGSQERVELIARIFAETGVKRAFKRILELACKHQKEAQMIRLRGKWVQMDPREWTTEFDVMINVGLGTGDRSNRLAHLMALGQIYQQIVPLQGGLNGPLVTGTNFFNWASQVVQAAGLRSAEMYFTDPANNPVQAPQQQDPDMVKAQGQLQIQQAQAQQQAQLKQAESQQQAQLEQMRIQAQMQLEQMKAEHQAQLDRQRAQVDIEIAHYQAQSKMQLEQAAAQHKMQLAQREIEMRAKAGAYVTGKDGDRTPAE